MGRWAQRRLGSSAGSGAGPNLISMTSAEVVGPNDIAAVYSADIDSGDFTAADFETLPNNFVATSVTQADANILNVSFGTNISAETSLRYTGAVPGIFTPQEIELT